jgi:hypothetical protein
MQTGVDTDVLPVRRGGDKAGSKHRHRGETREMRQAQRTLALRRLRRR